MFISKSEFPRCMPSAHYNSVQLSPPLVISVGLTVNRALPIFHTSRHSWRMSALRICAGNGLLQATGIASVVGDARRIVKLRLLNILLVLKFRDRLDPAGFRRGKGDLIAGMQGV